ncbi:MAG: HepT-like ribonuclease domain-containing protein, partial [Candidatus Jacksonbacteria bacterium]
ISKCKKPQTYRETFDILIKERIVSARLGKSLQNLIDFRNKLVHAYSNISLDRIYKIYTAEMPGIAEFIKIVKKFLTK